ncbi:putative membrane protein [Yarrowia sp. B02]|nr:putative membrane protein [Yarrowia sp. B02]
MSETAEHLGEKIGDSVGALGAVAAMVATEEMGWPGFLLSYITISNFMGLTLVTSPVTSYGDTLVAIRRKKSSAGFSIDVCGIMLVSSILRVMFWFGRPFELSLLIQSIVMIIMHLFLLKYALQYRPRADDRDIELGNMSSTAESAAAEKTTPPGSDTERVLEFLGLYGPIKATYAAVRHAISPETYRPEHRQQFAQSVSTAFKSRGRSLYPDISTSSRPFNFWNWSNDELYWSFLVKFTVWLVILQFLFGSYPLYVDTIGAVGLLIEAVLPLPQIIKNHQRQSVDGFRLSLLVSWLGGDLAKLAFFLSGKAEISSQFIMCSVIQTSLDCFVGVQYLYFQWKNRTKN